MNQKTDELDRREGCLIGLAVGDALGAPLEFIPRHRVQPITDMVSGGKFRLRVGEWTDDTAMAICLAESLLSCNGFHAADQMKRYWRWAEHGENSTRDYPFGIGKTVASALGKYRRSGQPFCGDTAETSSGNGSIMRLAPIPMRFAGHPELLERASESSRTTHASDACLSACRSMAQLIEDGLLGNACLHDRLTGDFRRKTLSEIRSGGYVSDTLEAALWCLSQTANFRDAVLLAANLGDDADTTAAVTGQIAGAFYGAKDIPEQWRERLYEHDRIRDLARAIYQAWRRSHVSCGQQ